LFKEKERSCRFSQKFGNGLIQRFGSCGGEVAVHNIAMSVDEKLFKIPFDACHKKGGFLLLQIKIYRVRIVAIYVDLLHERERDVKFRRAEGLNLRMVARLLRTELIARKSNDDETLVFVFFIEILHSLILTSETALRSHIYNQNDFALQLVEIEWSTPDIGGFEFIERTWLWSILLECLFRFGTRCEEGLENKRSQRNRKITVFFEARRITESRHKSS